MDTPAPVAPTIGGARSRNRLGASALPLIIFSLSMFLSATLLFVVEPMTGKMLMPLLGGTPAGLDMEVGFVLR